MRKGFVAACVVACGWTSAASADIKVDIDSSNTNPVTTQAGFASFNAGSTATDAQTVAPLTVDGVTFTLFGGLDGSRNRALNATITGDPYESLLRDFVFNDATSTTQGAGIGLRIEGLAVGVYDVQSFHYDAAANTSGSVQIEVRDRDVAGSTVILVDNAPFRPEPYAYQIEVTHPGQVLELVFREDDSLDRSRLNGFIIAPAVPEPGTAASLGALVGVLGAGRRRRRRR